MNEIDNFNAFSQEFDNWYHDTFSLEFSKEWNESVDFVSKFCYGECGDGFNQQFESPGF